MNDAALPIFKPSLFVKDLDAIVCQTAPLWEHLRGKKLFITGATGFFGPWLLESLLWANDKFGLNAELLILTRDAKKFYSKCPHLKENSALRCLEGDVKSFTFPEENFAYIIHAATDTAHAREGLSTWQTIVEGTKQVLEFAVHCQAKQLLFLSSGAVYGRQRTECTHFSETDLCLAQVGDKAQAYALGKYTAEHLCFLYAEKHGLDIKIARCFAFVGPYIALNSSFAIANFIANGLGSKDIIIQGDGRPYRSYLYMSDLAVWLWTILFQGKSLHPYNVGSDEAISLKALADLVASCFEHRPKVIVKQAPTALQPEWYVPNIQRAKTELHLAQTIDLPKAIEKTIQWYSAIGQHDAY